LNVAEITCATGTATAPFVGTVEITTGMIAGVCSRPQPVVAPVRSNARAQIVCFESLRITCSYSLRATEKAQADRSVSHVEHEFQNSREYFSNGREMRANCLRAFTPLCH
jgi:hypothetical protein